MTVLKGETWINPVDSRITRELAVWGRGFIVDQRIVHEEEMGGKEGDDRFRLFSRVLESKGRIMSEGRKEEKRI